MTRSRGLALSFTSPVLVGRDDVLALMLRRWRGAVHGDGHVLLLTGEAGIGKTRLLSALADTIDDARLLTASAFPRESDTPGGMLLNFADDLARSGDPERAVALRGRITAESDGRGDVARRRRLLVGDLARILESALVGRPTLLLMEDAHWADEVSLDVLARLVPVFRTSSCLVVVTFRSDEVVPGSSLASWRVRLLAQRQAEEARLGRLGREDVVAMAKSIAGASLSAAVVDVLVERTDGIPLHVEELLALGSDAVPDSIAESVRARAQRMPADTRAIMLAASVIGRSFDVDLLAIVARASPSTVERALQDLAAEHLVVGDASGDVFDFRHALLCDAVYRTIPSRRRRELHAAVALESLRRGLAEAMVSDHWERANDLAAAHSHALYGAHDASRRSAHREAAAMYRRAQRTATASIPPLDKAQLSAALAAELLAIDDAHGAAAQFATAIELFRANGDEVNAAALVPDLMAARHLLGAALDERTDLAHAALARLDDARERTAARRAGATPSDAVARGSLLVALAAANMLDRRLDVAAEFGARAEAVLAAAYQELDAPHPLAISLDTTLGSVLVFAGRGDEGWARLESAIRVAEAARLESEAARAHRMIGSSASVLFEYARAEHWIARGIEYTAQVERWNDHHYLVAHSAHVRWAVGDWHAADELARQALASGDGITTRITALHVRGYVALGRGLWAEARQHLEESRLLAERMGELQRLLPSLWGLAEWSLGHDDPVTALALCERALAASEAVDDAAYLLPFVVTGTRACLAAATGESGIQDARSWIDRCTVPLRRRALLGTDAALDHATALAEAALGRRDAARGLLESAERQWVSLGRWWEGAAALLDLARLAVAAGRPADAIPMASTARVRAETAGAAPLAQAAAALLDHPGTLVRLTARERDVARLIASGATNRSIAEQLVIAPKTVSTHVEHILTKLGASRRAEIAAWITRAEEPVR